MHKQAFHRAKAFLSTCALRRDTNHALSKISHLIFFQGDQERKRTDQSN